MRVSYNWLKELVPQLDLSPAEVGTKLTAIGLELEEVIEVGEGLETVVLCPVEAIEPHPQRDKLRLVTVTTGQGQLRVVCGAGNVPAPGGIVVLAPLGTYLPAVDLKLEPRKLGGIVSEGMLCSERELGLGQDSDGILTIEAGAFPAGTPLLTAYPFARDTVFELGITPNRPDALGHVGVARDLAAVLGLSWQAPTSSATASNESSRELDSLVTIENRAPSRCPAYGAAMVRGVKLGPSPSWLRWRLSALGIRPISNVVDITNLLLLEYGNPMHAFNLRRVANSTIIIRHATPGETLTTLDGVERTLIEDDLVIADGQRPSALAGIMGGADSEIRDDTSDVLLECAYFEPTGIRRTARRLAMHSDSSYRFERGVNWGALSDVLQRASDLLCELAGATAVPGQRFANGALPQLASIRLRKVRAERLLGMSIDFDDSLKSLEALGFRIAERSSTEATVEGTPFRPDIQLEADLIEEIARMRGLDAIPTVLPRISPQAPTPAGKLERRVRQWASAAGLSETITYSFVSPKELSALKAPEPVVTLKNPLTSERSVMTTSLLPGLLEVVRRARRRGEHDLRVFGVGSVFLAPVVDAESNRHQTSRPRAGEDVSLLPHEQLRFAAVLAGNRPEYLTKPAAYDVFDAKGLAVELVERFTGRTATTTWAGSEPSPLPHLHPRGAAQLWLGETLVGSFGPLHPDVGDELELGGPVQIVEIDLEAIERAGATLTRYRPIPRLPAVTRDIAVQVGANISAGDVQRTIEQHAGDLCESVTLFDLFEGGSMATGERSLAYRLVYRDPRAVTDPDNATTLTDKQVDSQHEKVVRAVAKIGAVPRA